MSRRVEKKTAAGQGNMYYVRPAFELPDPFPDPPTTMYNLNKAAPEPVFNGTENECSIEDDGRLRVQEQSTLCDFQNISEARVEEIESRQQVMLNKLTQLKDMIHSIHSKYVSESEEQSAAQESGTTTNQAPEHLDVVINANPKKPPYSLMFIYKALSSFGSIRFQSHVHSSVSSAREKYLNCFDQLEEQNNPDAEEKLCITLIWKNLPNDVDIELMVDPFNQTMIRGESNVARFLSRLLPGDSPLNYDVLQWETLVKVDGLLELASDREPVDPAVIEQQLLNHQRQGPFLFDQVSIADFVLFSTMAHQCASNPNKFNSSPNILRWLKDCQKFGGFELFVFY